MPKRRKSLRSRLSGVMDTPYCVAARLKRDEVSDFDVYPFCVPAIRHLHEIEFHPKVTFLVGENGSGKSTLLEAIAVKLGFNAEGGSKNFNFSTRATHSALDKSLVVARSHLRPMDGYFLRAESWYNVATEIDNIEKMPWCGGLLNSYGGKSLHEQSHGESFFSLLTHRLGGQGLYLFDEPEAALSPQRQLAMMVRMKDLIDDSSQFIIATHSPFIMAYPDAWIYQLGADGIQRVAYEDTDHYQITRAFLRDHHGMMQKLLGRDDELNLDDRRPGA